MENLCLSFEFFPAKQSFIRIEDDCKTLFITEVERDLVIDSCINFHLDLD
jgi:hypothetical protein